MNILHITENPIAGAPINLCRIQNKYSPDVDAKHIGMKANHAGRVFEEDIVVGKVMDSVVQDAFEWADIYHFHNFHLDNKMFNKYPHLKEMVNKKPSVIMYHTQRENPWVSFEESLANKNLKHLVIAQYHPRVFPDHCIKVPNMIDIWNELYMPIHNYDNILPCVAYAPGNISLKGWSDKGFGFTHDILRDLDRAGLIQKEIIIDRPHMECMTRKRTADIGIDEVVTGSYHLNSLEFLSLGLVSINDCDEITWGFMQEVCGAKDFPFVKANRRNLKETLTYYVNNRDELREKRISSRMWMEKHWDPNNLVKIYDEIYKSL